MSFNARPYLIFDGTSSSEGWTGAATLEHSWSYTNFFDKFVFTHPSMPPHYWGGSNAKPVPGLPRSERYDGVTALASKLLFWRDDRVVYSDVADHSCYIPIIASSGRDAFLTATGFSQPFAGGTANIIVPAAVQAEKTEGMSKEFTVGPFTVGQFLRIDRLPAVNFYKLLAVTEVLADKTVVQYLLTVRLLDKTGASAPSTTIPAGSLLVVMGPNEAGELSVVGDGTRNGPILQIVQTTDTTGLIFKERWVGAIQYVGKQAGVFSVGDALQDEGLIGRNAWCKVGSSGVAFLGQKELYLIQIGAAPEPLAMQASKELYDDLNRGSLDTVRLYHNSDANELWVLYPSLTLGGTIPNRVMVYNFVEKTVAFDSYDGSFGHVSAVGRMSWEQSAAWTVDPVRVPVAWEDDNGTWDDDGSGKQTITLMAVKPPTGGPTLQVHREGVFSRNGLSYRSEIQTIDFDFGDTEAFKYLDTVYFGLQVRNKLTGSNQLFVEAGARDNLDSDIRWSAPVAMQVGGNAVRTSKINVRRSGRYIRLKIYSHQTGIEWRLSNFRMTVRVGGTF